MTALLEKPVEEREYTPEDLLRLPDGGRYELVDGKLVEREMGFYTCLVSAEIGRLLGIYVEEHRLGCTPSPECGYQCFPDAPRKVRRSNASFIAIQRLPIERLHEGHVRIPPDLAAEVVSPNDLFSEVVEKMEQYLAAGVRLVWVVDPPSRTAYVYRGDGSVTRVRAHEELSGEDVVPDFRCRVGDLFPDVPVANAPT